MIFVIGFDMVILLILMDGKMFNNLMYGSLFILVCIGK